MRSTLQQSACRTSCCRRHTRSHLAHPLPKRKPPEEPSPRTDQERKRSALVVSHETRRAHSLDQRPRRPKMSLTRPNRKRNEQNSSPKLHNRRRRGREAALSKQTGPTRRSRGSAPTRPTHAKATAARAITPDENAFLFRDYQSTPKAAASVDTAPTDFPLEAEAEVVAALFEEPSEDRALQTDESDSLFREGAVTPQSPGT